MVAMTTSFCLCFIFSAYNVHVYMRPDGLAGTIVADMEYPARVAYVLLSQLLAQCADQVGCYTGVNVLWLLPCKCTTLKMMVSCLDGKLHVLLLFSVFMAR